MGVQPRIHDDNVHTEIVTDLNRNKLVLRYTVSDPSGDKALVEFELTREEAISFSDKVWQSAVLLPEAT